MSIVVGRRRRFCHALRASCWPRFLDHNISSFSLDWLQRGSRDRYLCSLGIASTLIDLQEWTPIQSDEGKVLMSCTNKRFGCVRRVDRSSLRIHLVASDLPQVCFWFNRTIVLIKTVLKRTYLISIQKSQWPPKYRPRPVQSLTSYPCIDNQKSPRQSVSMRWCTQPRTRTDKHAQSRLGGSRHSRPLAI